MIYPSGPFFGEIAVREEGRGQRIEDRQFRDLVRIVERHATRHSRPLVVADYSELFKTEVRHDFDLVLSHGAFGIIGMIRSVCGLAAVSVAPQIGGHDGKPLGQPRRHFVPHDMSLRITVQQQHRRPASAHDRVDGRPAGVNAHRLEAGKEIRPGRSVASLLRPRCLIFLLRGSRGQTCLLAGGKHR